jgi:dTDP-4-amino-4,6-dideoxygalactose transaminase
VKVPFNAIAVQDAALRESILAAIARVVERGWFVLGEEGEAFEREFAPVAGGAHAAGVGNGTDAIRLALEAVGVRAGDDVVTVPMTAAYTALAISMLGARPVFCDVEPRTLTMDPDRLEAAITPATRAIVPVHLYGQCADMRAIGAIADRRGIPVVEDCAQAVLAQFEGRPAGSFGQAAAFSFYPTKNLGAYGDGGAVTSNDAAVIATVKRLRNGGQSERYRHVERGVNSRLDELQAAVLRVKLANLPAATEARRAQAARYDARLRGVERPAEAEGRRHVYHLYPVRHPRRDALAAALAAAGIGTIVHYPIPVHLQPAYAHLGLAAGVFPQAERAGGELLSLPLYPGLPADQQDAVIEAVLAFAAAPAS